MDSYAVLSRLSHEHIDGLLDHLYASVVGIIVGHHAPTARDSAQTLQESWDLRSDFHTGFLFSIHGILLVVTAGHVIDAIHSIGREGRVIRRFRIADRGPQDGNNTGVPVRFDHAPAMKLFNWDKKDEHDYGCLAIPPFEANAILAGGTVRALDITTIPDHTEYFDAYVLLGFPNSARTDTHHCHSLFHRHRMHHGCPLLPVTPLPKDLIPAIIDQSVPRFIAKIDVSPDDDPKLADIHGMSGGPVFGLRMHSDRVECKLVAIQSGWHKPSNTITACYAAPLFRPLYEEAARQIQAIIDTRSADGTPEH